MKVRPINWWDHETKANFLKLISDIIASMIIAAHKPGKIIYFSLKFQDL